LKVPIVSKPPSQASRHFGFLAPFVATDNPSSSGRTRERLGWEPQGPRLLDDLREASYFAAGK
jgi:hypothetical protein